jgi:hypothetical protein
MRKLTPVPLNSVSITGGFWAKKLDTNRRHTIPHIYQQLAQTGRLVAMTLTWKEGQPNKPHIFWDSDAAKWIEAAAYSLVHHADPELEAQVDAYVDLMEKAQSPDGYLNSFFQTVEPHNRWTNVRDRHEMYCAGHLIEAAVAYYQATGKSKMLEIMRRYADHIATVFGPAEGQKHGYPGHQEIELALVKLYRLTGERRYLDLAVYFLNERGKEPNFYDVEAYARGDDPSNYKFFRLGNHAYNQSHVPVREQTDVVGHAVRAMYMYSGMIDAGVESGDLTLLDACVRLWSNLTEKRMYITAGIGPAAANEGFTVDYDLPNQSAYAETCAAIALVFWAQRILQVYPDRKYADVMERALYNGILSGVSTAGDDFFYANLLARRPEAINPHSEYETGERRPWFTCACCPPNLARLFADLGEYIYASNERELYVHLYVESQAEVSLGGREVRVEQKTNYPWDEEATFSFEMASPASFALALRVPGWCREAQVWVNGQPVDVVLQDGYARIERTWQNGDQVLLRLPMPVERIEAHPYVAEDRGRLALQRGPVVYCLEEIDNGPSLDSLRLPPEPQFTVRYQPDLLDGSAVIQGELRRRSTRGWEGQLYQPARNSQEEFVPFTAIPYALWANRGMGEMIVWLRT